jgi:PAS domain-containing protein
MYVFDNASLAILAVNDAAVAKFGWSREEFLKMTIEDIRPPEESPAVRSYRERVLMDARAGLRSRVKPTPKRPSPFLFQPPTKRRPPANRSRKRLFPRAAGNASWWSMTNQPFAKQS